VAQRTRKLVFREEKMRSKSLIAVLVCSIFVSCRDNHTVTVKLRDFEKPVPSGLQKIQQARQMEELFGSAAHAISNLRDDGLTAEWKTIVLFGGRYELWMTVPVRLTENFDEVTVVLRTPEFKLFEVSATTDEGRGVLYDPRGARHFSADDWAKIYRAKGDFSVVGIAMKQNQPVRNFDRYKQIVLRPHRDPALAALVGKIPKEFKLAIDPHLVQIGGESTEYFPYGALSIVRIVEKPEIVIAVGFSRPVRIEPGPGPSGNKDGNAGWSHADRAMQPGKTEPIRIDWEYSTRTQKLLFNGVAFDLPFDRIAVVKMHDGTPTLELQMKTDAAIRTQRLHLGWIEGQQTQTHPPLPARELSDGVLNGKMN
jgi:hypothetical protein